MVAQVAPRWRHSPIAASMAVSMVATRKKASIRMLAAFAALLGGGRLLAGTVEISVVERGAGPVPDQIVVLYPARQDARYAFPHLAKQCVTGPSGRCQIAGLPAGIYYADVPQIANPNLCAPAGSPIEAYGTVTLVKAEATASLRIELHRGVRINFRVIVRSTEIPKGSRIELGDDTGENVSVPVDGLAAQATVRTGRWIAHLVGPQGARVTKVELDGAAIETLDVPIEVVAPSSERFVDLDPERPVHRLRPGDEHAPASRGPDPSAHRGARAVGRFIVLPHRGLRRLRGSPVGPQRGFTSSRFRAAPGASPPPAIRCSSRIRRSSSSAARRGRTCAPTSSSRRRRAADPDGCSPSRSWTRSGSPIADVPVEAWPTGRKVARQARRSRRQRRGRTPMPAVFRRLAKGSYLLRARSPGIQNGGGRGVRRRPGSGSGRATSRSSSTKARRSTRSRRTRRVVPSAGSGSR